MKKARYLSIEEKLGLLLRIEAGGRLAAVAEETGVLRKSLYEWRAAYRAMGAAGLNRKCGPKPGGRAAGGTPTGRSRFLSPSLAVMGQTLRSWDEKRRGGGAPISSRSSKK